MKKNLHPKWFLKTPVYCAGKLIKYVSSTKSHLYVNIWSKTHPFFLKSNNIFNKIGQIEIFLKKYKKKKIKYL